MGKFVTVYGKHARIQQTFPDESRTVQASKDECDINNIMKRFHKTGALPSVIRQDPTYGDFADAVDYHEACNIVVRAREQFDLLDSRVREEFGNDPEAFLKFAGNPENADKMAKMGLMTPEAVKRVTEQRRAKEGDSVEDVPRKTPKSKTSGSPSGSAGASDQ